MASYSTDSIVECIKWVKPDVQMFSRGQKYSSQNTIIGFMDLEQPFYSIPAKVQCLNLFNRLVISFTTNRYNWKQFW